MKLKSITLHIKKDGVCIHLTCQPEEAFAIVIMPAFAGLVSEMVPEYGLSPLHGSEDQE